MNRKVIIAASAIAAVAVTAGIVSMLHKQESSPVFAPARTATTKAPPVATLPQPRQQVATVNPQQPLPTNKAHKRNTAEIIQPAGTPMDPEVVIREAKLDISNLAVRNVGGIVILRGESDRDTAMRAEKAIHDAGYARVANLIRQQAAVDDDAIRRDAERQLAKARSLDGCRFAVTCERGVLKVNATIQSALQEDATRLVLRQIQGVRDVQATFARF
jgi:hypothetical protein